MSEENIEIVRRAYEALNRGDWDAVLRDAHPEFELTTQRGPNAGTHRGRERAQQFAEDYLEAFDDAEIEPEEYFESGDQVVVLVVRRARPKGSSAEMVVRNGHVFTLSDGMILSMKSFPDPDAALEAAGVSR